MPYATVAGVISSRLSAPHFRVILAYSRAPTRLFLLIALLILAYMRSFWMIGSIFAATTAWVLLGDGFDGSRIVPGGTWRHYAMMAALPAATALVLTIFFVPESPRFLAKAGRATCEACTIGEVTMTDVIGVISHHVMQHTLHDWLLILYAQEWSCWFTAGSKSRRLLKEQHLDIRLRIVADFRSG